MVVISLPAGNSSIVLECNESGWCQVYIRNGVNTYLGADSTISLKKKLRDFLDNRNALSVVGVHDGKEVGWVLCLDETHTTVYSARESECVILYMQDQDAKFFATTTISNAECDQWYSLLDPVAPEDSK